MCGRNWLSMVTVLLLSVVLLSLVSCGSAEPIVETVVVKETVVSEIPVTVEVTRIAEIQVTRLVEVKVTRLSEVERIVTATPRPTPRPTSTPERSMEDFQADVGQALISDLEELGDVERVNLVRFDTGLLELELVTVWASRDRQPEVSWTVVTMLARVFADTTPGQRFNLTGTEDLSMRLTTYSTDGDYRYISKTDYPTMVKLNNRSISYEEWVQAANAGFR